MEHQFSEQKKLFKIVRGNSYEQAQNWADKKKKKKTKSLVGRLVARKNKPTARPAVATTSRPTPGKPTKKRTKIGKVLKGVGKVVRGVGKVVTAPAKYAVLIPLMPIMGKALKDRGLKPPKGVQKRAELFHKTFIAKTGNYEVLDFDSLDADQDHLAESAVAAIVSFIKDIVQKKKRKSQAIKDAKERGLGPEKLAEIEAAMPELPPVLDKIANGGIKLETTLREKAKEQIATETGATVLKFSPLLIGGGLGALLLIVFLASRS